MAYKPTDPPNVADADLQRALIWVADELRRLSNEFGQRDFVAFRAYERTPVRPVLGEVRYANGTNWNPGGGAGLYEYTAGGANGWRMLASGTQY